MLLQEQLFWGILLLHLGWLFSDLVSENTCVAHEVVVKYDKMHKETDGVQVGNTGANETW